MTIFVRGLTIVLMCAAVLTAVPSRSVALACQAQNQPLVRITEEVCSGTVTYEILELEPEAFSSVLPSGLSAFMLMLVALIFFTTIALIPTTPFILQPQSPPPRFA